MAVVFREARDGDLQAQLVLHHGADDLHLAAAAVSDDEVRERLSLLLQARIAAPYHLAHGGVVVRADHGADVVFPVILLARLEFLEYHACRHSVGSADVGVVEKLDAQGQAGQAQVLLDFLHEARLLLLGIELFGLFEAVEPVLFHVQAGEFEEFFLVPLLRDDLHGHFFGDVDLERHHDFLRTAAVALPHLDDAEREQFAVRFLQLLLVLEGEGLVDAAVRHVEIVDVGHLLLALDVEHVDVVEHGRDHLALRLEALDEFVALLDGLRLLEAQFGRQSHHFIAHFPLHLPRVALQYLLARLDGLQVVRVRLPAHAGPLAAVDMVVQADLVLALLHAFAGHGRAAGARLVEFAAEVQQGVHRRHVAVRPEIDRPALAALPRLEDARQILRSHRNARVRLVVLEQHVVVRLVALDEVVLEQQRVLLRLHHHVADVADAGHEEPCLARLLLLVEVRAHAPLQVLCLADVDNRSAFIEVLVAARRFGEVVHDAFEVGRGFFVAAHIDKGGGNGSLKRAVSPFASRVRETARKDKRTALRRRRWRGRRAEGDLVEEREQGGEVHFRSEELASLQAFHAQLNEAVDVRLLRLETFHEVVGRFH